MARGPSSVCPSVNFCANRFFSQANGRIATKLSQDGLQVSVYLGCAQGQGQGQRSRDTRTFFDSWNELLRHWRSGIYFNYRCNVNSRPTTVTIDRDVRMSYVQGVPKNLAPLFLYALTLPNINRFSKLFHYQNQEKICNNTVTKDPTIDQVCRYTTLWNVSVIKATEINNRKQRVYCLSYCLK